jgi:hypothetical protein
MRKFLRYLLIIVGIVLVIGLAGFSFIEIRGVPRYEVKKVDFTLKSTPESIERGKKLHSCFVQIAIGIMRRES